MYIDEPIYTKELNDRADNILSKYSLGKLLVKGDNRYLSDDLLRLIAHISNKADVLSSEFLSGNLMYAPKPAYEENEFYTVLRSPHIARNEEVLSDDKLQTIESIDLNGVSFNVVCDVVAFYSKQITVDCIPEKYDKSSKDK